MHYFDYIIAGSGLTGLYSAYLASRYGKVALITKSGIRESNSYFAQGGIAAVTDNEDLPEFHFEDTIIAGRGLCDYDAVNVLVNEGPLRIHELIEEGMEFDMSGGALSLGLEGGHHKRRILHAGGDVTGRKITDFMIKKVTSDTNISIFENYVAIEIITDGDSCKGLRCWNLNAGQEEIFLGNHTILALGGASAIYKNTTNPDTTTGDGVALAYRAGCRIADMEFIQFNPTSLYTREDKPYLISEAVRGEGAYLVNEKGERFMPALHEAAELAPRDIVARAIYKEIQSQKLPYVYLTLSHINPDRLSERFPNISQKCREMGYDFNDRIPVAPAAHYMVGGVRTDLNARTNIRDLYVCGELASTGIMGANRLASNSLLECLVFGYRAVKECERSMSGRPAAERSVSESDLPAERFFQKINKKGRTVVPGKFTMDPTRAQEFSELSNRISEILTVYAGIVRNRELLTRGLEKIEEESAGFVREGFELYNLMGENLLIVARLIMQSALFRHESRGGHYREDFPSEDKSYIFHIIQKLGEKITTLPVDTTKDNYSDKDNNPDYEHN
ncbi:MAG: L-aspartate oxidase [Bacteroidales bacterium]|nr:L-aspartate oxidase [Bacteroidales bacterium]